MGNCVWQKSGVERYPPSSEMSWGAEMAALRRGAGGAVVTATLSYLGLISTEADPVLSFVNPEDELLEAWDMDSNASAAPECRFVDGSKVYESRLCTHFVIGRAASSPPRAFERALACAAKFQTSCVLSPEIGLAVPAVFLVHATETTMVLAPRVHAPLDNSTVGVRLRDPSNALNTRKIRFNKTVSVSYLVQASARTPPTRVVASPFHPHVRLWHASSGELDGRSRRQESRVFDGGDAHCISLLRVSFAPSCWENID